MQLIFFPVKFLLLSVLALAGAALGQRNVNQCAGVTDETTFVNDWAHCSDYFWCNFDQTVPSGPCPDGFGFDVDQQRCSQPAATGCDTCPAEGNIAVSSNDEF